MPTRLRVAGQADWLSGDIELRPANNIALTQEPAAIEMAGAAGHVAQAVDVFAPGTMTARTLLVLHAPTNPPVLRRVDAEFKTAPAGVSSGSRARLRVRGATSGDVSLPFDSAAAGWHTDFGAKSALARTTDTWADQAVFSDRGKAMNFKAVADMAVANLAFRLADAITGASAFRVGIAAPINPSGVTFATIPWRVCRDDSPAFVDVPAAGLSIAAGSPSAIAALPAMVDLAAGTEHCIVLARVAQGDTLGPDQGGSTWLAGSNAAAPTTNSIGARMPSGGAGFTLAGDNDNKLGVALIGNVVGVPLQGDVTISVELDGSPATPGADLVVHLEL